MSKTFNTNGIELFYRDIGQGYPLLLLTGFTGTGEGLLPLFENFENDHRLIIPDIRGHGRSTNPSGKFTFRDAAADIMALLESLGIKECAAFGLSGGGCTLLHMAHKKPNLIKSMVLVSAAPYFPEQAKSIMRQFTIESRTPAEWEAMQAIHPHGDEQIKMLWTQAREMADTENDMAFTPEMLSTIQTRTLIIQGDRDPFYPIDLTIEMYKAIPNADLWIVPHAGHGPIFDEMLEPFKKAFGKFIHENNI